MVKELDNPECLAAARAVAKRPTNIFEFKDPISLGALLWHDMIEIREGEFAHLTNKGRAWLKDKDAT